jgi:hypothetical protein
LSELSEKIAAEIREVRGPNLSKAEAAIFEIILRHTGQTAFISYMIVQRIAQIFQDYHPHATDQECSNLLPSVIDSAIRDVTKRATPAKRGTHHNPEDMRPCRCTKPWDYSPRLNGVCGSCAGAGVCPKREVYA